MSDVYLDIETTGLTAGEHYITVIGLYLVGKNEDKVVQLVGDDVTASNLLELLQDVETIFTYNGGRFDLPFIKDSIGVNLNEMFAHHDLMFDCWQCNLYGGFKSVEVKLGIKRQLQGINGLEAISLWEKYRQDNDRQALDRLLHYNREDVMNLKTLREKLSRIPYRRVNS